MNTERLPPSGVCPPHLCPSCQAVTHTDAVRGRLPIKVLQTQTEGMRRRPWPHTAVIPHIFTCDLLSDKHSYNRNYLSTPQNTRFLKNNLFITFWVISVSKKLNTENENIACCITSLCLPTRSSLQDVKRGMRAEKTAEEGFFLCTRARHKRGCLFLRETAANSGM